MKQTDTGRRHFLLGAAYIAPAILTLSVTPSFASTGSTRVEDASERSGYYSSKVKPTDTHNSPR